MVHDRVSDDDCARTQIDLFNKFDIGRAWIMDGIARTHRRLVKEDKDQIRPRLIIAKFVRSRDK